MKFDFEIIMKLLVYFHITPLNRAVKKENIEIIKLLLENPNINVNIPNVLKFNILILFINKFFYRVLQSKYFIHFIIQF